MKKRVLSLLLVFLLFVSLLPAASFAEDIELVDTGDIELVDTADEPEPNGSVAINATNFPDDKFRQLVHDYFDTNGDGSLSAAEIKEATYFHADFRNIYSLKGIEFLTSLTNLSCSENHLTELDLSKNTALQILGCSKNQLTSLDLSKNTALVTLACSENQLTSLDLSKNTNLEALDCWENQLKSLDLSHNPRLVYLECQMNQLTSLNVKGAAALETLECYDNRLTSLDVSGSPNLTELICLANKLKTLDVSRNPALYSLNCTENQLTSLKLNGAAALERLYCWGNQLTSLDVSGSPYLRDLSCYSNSINTLDIGRNPHLLQAFLNGVKEEWTSEDHSSYLYHCSHPSGGTQIELDVDTFTVIKTAPKISTQPKSVIAGVGSKATFTVAAGAGEYSYQWQFRKSSSGTWANSSLTGSTTDTLTVEATAARNGYQYRCKVTSIGGTVTSDAATLTVIAKPTITTQPKSVTAGVGSTVKFTVAASGSGLSYQWLFRKNSSESWTKSTMTGATTKTLTVEATTARNGYQYQCVVSNVAGKVYSHAATLTVVSKPTITTQPKSVGAAVGSTVKFTVAASGGGLSYQWLFRKNSSESWTKSTMPGATTKTLTVEATAARNGYQYQCQVSNAAGKVYSHAATLTIVSEPTITTQPKSVTAAAGETVKFTVAATGGGLSYQWQFRKDSSTGWSNSGMTGCKTATLTVEATAARSGYQYRCKVTNAAGTVITVGATLTVVE